MSISQVILHDDFLLKSLLVMWKVPVPSKVICFGWRFFLRGLPIMDNLLSREVLLGTHHGECLMGRQHGESIPHLFFHCSFAQKIWQIALAWMGA